jgi:hypothetical protein
MPGRHGPFPVAMFLPKVMGSILDFKRKGDKNGSNSNNNSHNSNQLFRIYIMVIIYYLKEEEIISYY